MVAVIMSWASNVISALAFGGDSGLSERVRVAKAEFDESLKKRNTSLEELRAALKEAECAHEDMKMHSIMLLKQADEDRE